MSVSKERGQHDAIVGYCNNPFDASDTIPPEEPPPARSNAVSVLSETKLLSKLKAESYLRRISARASAACPGKRLVTWIGNVHVLIVNVRDIPPSDGADVCSGEVYVKLKLNDERYITTYKPRSNKVKWMEQSYLYLYPTTQSASDVISNDKMLLDISLRHHDMTSRDHVIAQCVCHTWDRSTIDLSDLERNKTVELIHQLGESSAKIHIFLTVSYTVKTQQTSLDCSSHLSLGNLRDVGRLQVTVISAHQLAAVDLSGTSDPYCVLQVNNSRCQTNTEYKTLSPQWNNTFIFDVTDIHDALHVTVLDENPDKKVDFLGKIVIPLLSIGVGKTRSYQLKNAMLTGPAKGHIELAIKFTYSVWKAAFKTIHPRDVNYTKPQPRFRVSTMKYNAHRISRHIQPLKDVYQQLEYCLDWNSTVRSVAALIIFTAGVLLFEPFMLTTLLLFIFFKNFITNKLHSRNNANDDEVDECDVEYREDSNSKVEKKSLADKWQTIQEMCLHVQQGLDDVASMIERINNMITWRVPWLSWLAVIMLSLLTFLFYVVPLRCLVLVWGLIHFTRKLRRPDSVHHSGILDFLFRVPNNKQLLEFSGHQRILCGQMSGERPMKKQQ